MKPFKMLPLLILLSIFPFIILNGCGGGGGIKSVSIPDKSTITVGPDHSQQGISMDTPVNYTIVVRYEDNTPIPHAKVKVSGSMAAPKSNPQYQFYRYPDALGDPRNVAPGGAVDSGFIVETGDDGTYTFSALIFDAGFTFGDNIVCTSGTAMGFARIEIT